MIVTAAYFRGQFADEGSSLGIDKMASQARANGISTAVFNYEQFVQGKAFIDAARKRGDKIAVIGYSLGAGDVTALSHEGEPIDLLIALDPSQLGYNYKLDKKHTKRSVLWYDNNWILNGPLGHAGRDLGFDVIHTTADWHLWVDLDPIIQANVLSELLKLKEQ